MVQLTEGSGTVHTADDYLHWHGSISDDVAIVTDFRHFVFACLPVGI